MPKKQRKLEHKIEFGKGWKTHEKELAEKMLAKLVIKIRQESGK